ncbi:MAG: tRNA 2-selenouridine(34) synthase MnmH [Calditrichaeota bacterium]|nr:MAG: tRNA 2-selenouridine(34) synthase MnmH [Calditrichota bacterium]
MAEIRRVDITEFMKLARRYPIFDVRTPAEFEKGHIPGAHNLPLFSNDERALIGLTYHQQGREEAMLLGLERVGPRMRAMVERVRKITRGGKTVLVHCWRGGMRSGSVAWLINLFGYDVYVLEKGYKAYRRFVLDSFETPRNVVVLSGRTGTGKTEILHYLREMGEQVIDLEALAHHKGSSFGSLGEAPQPSQEWFENQLSDQWLRLDPERVVWVEDESRKIGSRIIPEGIWKQMRSAPVIFLDMPVELRAKRLVESYGAFSAQELKAAIERLQERLGGLHTQQAVRLLEQRELEACCRLLLTHYYDKTYLHGLSRRDPSLIHRVETLTVDPRENARKVRLVYRSLSPVEQGTSL